MELHGIGVHLNSRDMYYGAVRNEINGTFSTKSRRDTAGCLACTQARKAVKPLWRPKPCIFYITIYVYTQLCLYTKKKVGDFLEQQAFPILLPLHQATIQDSVLGIHPTDHWETR
jgi:hypothetical protein